MKGNALSLGIVRYIGQFLSLQYVALRQVALTARKRGNVKCTQKWE